MDGRRKSIDTQISDLEKKKTQFQTRIGSAKTKINEYESSISELDKQIEDLKAEKAKEEVLKLSDFLHSIGKTPDEAIAELEKLNKTEESAKQ
jgi:chromosome segregation ATPase